MIHEAGRVISSNDRRRAEQIADRICLKKQIAADIQSIVKIMLAIGSKRYRGRMRRQRDAEDHIIDTHRENRHPSIMRGMPAAHLMTERRTPYLPGCLQSL